MPKQKISDAQRFRMEEERKKKLEMEAKFKCDIEEMADTEAEKLMEGRDVYLKNQRVSYGMDNWGNTCFFNAVLQCLIHTVPLHQLCVNNKSH